MSKLRSQIDVYFVNYRESYDFAKQTTLTEPIEAYLYYFSDDSSQQMPNADKQPILKRLKYPNRPDHIGMQSFLIKHGFMKDTTNFALKKIANLKIFDAK